MEHICLNCGQGKMQHQQQDVTAHYNHLSVIVPAVSGWHCPECGEVEFDNGEGERYASAIKALKQQEALMLGVELARIRKKLGLTQQQAARLAGGGKNAFSRYENGEAKPVAAVINLFKLLDHHPEMLQEVCAA